MKALFPFLVLVCVWHSVGIAEILTASDPACACNAKTSDLFEEPVKFNFGRNKGQCIDSCRFRRGRILRKSGQVWRVANILHLGGYVQASIPFDKVKAAYVGFERFAFGVDHVFLKLTFSEDIELFSQTVRSERAGSTRSIVISSEGVPAVGQNYTLMDGYFGNYLLDHRLVTWGKNGSLGQAPWAPRTISKFKFAS